MNKSLTAAVLSVPMLLSVGCVAQSKYDELDQAYRKTLEQVTERDARIAELESQIAALRLGPESDKVRIAELMAERDRLMKELEDLNGKFGNLKFQEHIALPANVDAALREWASQNPDLVEYDSARGMVKFRSDITFRLGSAELNPAARTALGRFAQILNSPEIRGYEALVIGHTDSVPIKRETTKDLHPTNWHLSAHRAISVRDAIEQSGVSPVRTSIAGYSYFRPVVQNTRSGAEPNRRVEIYIRPMTPVNESYLTGTGGSAPRTVPATPLVPATTRPASSEIPLK
jgi:chemotaxis protein MotB